MLLFSLCANDKVKNLDIEKLIDYVDVCKVPKFPYSGDYLKNHGYETGPSMGRKLKTLEEKWIENKFILDQKIVEKSLRKNKEN